MNTVNMIGSTTAATINKDYDNGLIVTANIGDTFNECVQKIIYDTIVESYNGTLYEGKNSISPFDEQSMYDTTDNNKRNDSLDSTLKVLKKYMRMCSKCKQISALLIGTIQMRSNDESATPIYKCTNELCSHSWKG